MDNDSKKAHEIQFQNVRYVSCRVVADFYEVSSRTVQNWIKEGKISGKQLAEYNGEYFVPAEEFEYLKKKIEENDTEDIIKELFEGEYFYE